MKSIHKEWATGRHLHVRVAKVGKENGAAFGFQVGIFLTSPGASVIN